MDLCTASSTKIGSDLISQSDDRQYPEITCPDCGKPRVSVSPKMGEAKDGLYTITKHLPMGTARTRSATVSTISPVRSAIDPLEYMRIQRKQVITAIENGPALHLKDVKDLADLRGRIATLENRIAGYDDRMANLIRDRERWDLALESVASTVERDPKTTIVDRPE